MITEKPTKEEVLKIITPEDEGYKASMLQAENILDNFLYADLPLNSIMEEEE